MRPFSQFWNKTMYCTLQSYNPSPESIGPLRYRSVKQSAPSNYSIFQPAIGRLQATGLDVAPASHWQSKTLSGSTWAKPRLHVALIGGEIKFRITELVPARFCTKLLCVKKYIFTSCWILGLVISGQ